MSRSSHSTASRALDPLALFAVSATVLVWGASYSAIRIALVSLTPVEIAVLRYSVAATVAAVFLAIVRPKLPSLGEFARLAIVGVLYVAGFAILLNWGQQTVSAGTAGFVVGTTPVMIALLAVLALGEKFGRISWLGAVISFVGIGLIALASGDSFAPEFGVILVLGAALAAAAASIVQKPLLTRFTALALTSWILILGVVPLLPALPDAVGALSASSSQVVWAVAVLAVFSTIVGYVGWSVALQRMSASSAGSFLNGVPLAATAIGFVWIGEVPTSLGLAGGLVALSGVVIVNLAKGR